MLAAVFEILTVGLPFCAFKLIAGVTLAQDWLTAWGLADTIINVANLLWLIVLRRRVTEICLLSLVIRFARRPPSALRRRWQQIGTAGDMFFSFAIVALMLGGGFLTRLPAWQLQAWNLSVILNVLGAGSMRLSQSVAELRKT